MIKKIISLSALLLICVMANAQDDYSAVITKTNSSQIAIPVDDIDSIVYAPSANVEPSYFGNTSKWKGKIVGFLGNSITQNGEYVRSYASLTGCTAINYGVSGTHIAKTNSSTTNAFENRCSSMRKDLDLLIVFGGTNDFGHTSTAAFGQFSDGTNPNTFTFYAGLHRLFSKLYKMYRGKPVVIMTPIHHGVEVDAAEYTYSDNGTKIRVGKNPTTDRPFIDYVNAIKEVAAYYSFIVIDAYSYSRLSPMTEIGAANRRYFKDGLHPNDAGGLRLAKWMYPQLEQVYDMFY